MKFHVEHNVTPANMRTILPILSTQNELDFGDLTRAVQQIGQRISTDYMRRNLNVMGQFGLVSSHDLFYRLTAKGAALQHLLVFRPSVFQDVMHYLYYASWDLTHRNELAFSWTYQTICGLLWDARPSLIQADNLAGELLSLAQTTFPSEERIAISPYAIEGAYHWIAAINPPFVELPAARGKRSTSRGRTRCSPELLILGIDYVYRMLELPYRAPLLLDQSRIDSICRLCLLNPSEFSAMAELTRRAFDTLTAHSGEWGLFLVLGKGIRLEELT